MNRFDHNLTIPRLLGRRRFWAGMVMAVVTLVVGALMAAKSASDASAQIQRGSALGLAYQNARSAMFDEQNAEAAYWAAPGAAVAARVNGAAASVVSALHAVDSRAQPADRAAVARALTEQSQVRREFAQLQQAVATGDSSEAAGRQGALLPELRAMNGTVAGASDQIQRELLASLSAARRAEATVLVATVFAFVFGALLVAAGLSALYYKRRFDAARDVELEQMRLAALTDSLTGLRNLRAFQDDLARMVNAAEPVCLTMLNLDGLRELNERHGHPAGDEHIRLVAAALASETGDACAAYRIGGERFAVVMPARRPLDGVYLVASLLQRLRTKGGGDPAACTGGVAEMVPGIDRDGLVRRAGVALVEARRAHRQALVYTAEMEARVGTPIELRRRGDLDGLATALARAVDAKDPYTHSHCETVSELAAMIAEELGLAPHRVARVRLAGLLHDVGKIGIPDAILGKPGPLTDAEYETMKQHPTLGHHILSAAELTDIAEWIRHHHERIDGCGYPDGLAGDAIPFESRILMVADAFEAITADRPYRDRRSIGEAMVELERHSGTQFDPRCLAALERVVGPGPVVAELVPGMDPAMAGAGLTRAA